LLSDDFLVNNEDAFKDGMALILGEVWRGQYEAEYLIFIYLDNLKAIEEFCRINGVTSRRGVERRQNDALL
jgi:hypothetical protein